MSYMRTLTVLISRKDPFYVYADRVTMLANNLYNAARFRQRQLMTAAKKPADTWTENELEVLEEIYTAFPEQFSENRLPKSSFLCSYDHMERLMRQTGNPDFFVDGLSRQCCQQILKQASRDMKSYFSALRDYKKAPERYTGKPKLPGYRKKGGRSTVPFTNQDCTIVPRNGKWFAAFPLNKKELLPLGNPLPDTRLKEVTITPENGRFRCCFKFEIGRELPTFSERASRICAIDLGVENLMAVTNNCGLPCLLYKGGIAKSANRLYNKRTAEQMQQQTKGTDRRFVPDAAFYTVTNRRNDRIDDFFHKCAKHLVTWCVENRIDTLVAGSNTFWKQKVQIGTVNTQNFVQLPFQKLKSWLAYLCEWNGIRYIEQEESYTSKASFPDLDPLPVYKKGEEVSCTFSGKRRPSSYQGMKRPGGFRGLYQTADGTIINADLNGSANILRKAFPEAFAGTSVDFTSVHVIHHPDQGMAKRKELSHRKPDSHAKQKRQRRKAQRAA